MPPLAPLTPSADPLSTDVPAPVVTCAYVAVPSPPPCVTVCVPELVRDHPLDPVSAFPDAVRV